MEWFFTGYGAEARIAALIVPVILAVYWVINDLSGKRKGKGSRDRSGE